MRKFLFLFLWLGGSSLFAQSVLALKERAKAIEQIQQERFEVLLPQLMQAHDIDAWVIITREYNEDPVVKTMLPPTWLNARRRTILVFTKDINTGEVNRAAITRYPFGKLIPSVWKKEEEPDQMKALADYLAQKNPVKIGINTSDHYGIADGLAKTDYDLLVAALPKGLKKRLVSATPLAVAWIESRTPQEMVVYNQLVEITHNIIAEAFSTQVITPGITTTDDVVWWMREKVLAMGLKTWFHPTIDVQRDENSDLYAFDGKSKYDIIQPGDLVHCDFGITYLGLNTDCQELAYVLKRGEIAAPDYLTNALAEGNAVQDIFTAEFNLGRTGNETLALALAKGKEAGYRPQIYTHPLGAYGHSAGTTFGMWDAQEGVPGSGDWPLHENTVYAIELNTKVYITEWQKDIRVMLEEAGYFGPEGFSYVNKRQTDLFLIGN
ncbi:MAG: M24 family metallopeptidase [Candidatus Arcticimaribacter sp.]